jgi:hypothetical protein
MTNPKNHKHESEKNGRLINPQLVYEATFPVCDSRRRVDTSPRTVRRLIDEGRRSLATGQFVKLECCQLPTGQLATSVQAFNRFKERLNGAV